MKFNIQKLQSGGGFYSPHYIINAPQQVQARPEQGGISPNAKLMDDELYKKLMEGPGLTSDARIVAQEIIEFEQNPTNFLNPNSVEKLKLYEKIGELERQRKTFEFARQTAKEKNTLEEIAISPGGGLFVRDKDNKIRQIGVEEYNKNRNSYNTMTVSELLNARQMESQLAFNTDVYAAVESNVSTDEIFQKINTILDKVGSITEQSERFVDYGGKTPTKSEQEGLKELNDLVSGSPEGIYKITEKKVTPNVQQAFNYIWTSLRPEEKQKLKIISSLSGNKDSSVTSIIQTAISSQLSASYEFKPDYQKELSESSGKTAGGLTDVKPFEAFIKGLFPTGESFKWNDPKAGLKMEIPSMGSSKLVDLNNNHLGYAKLGAVERGLLGKVVDLSNVTFGGQTIDPDERNKIIASNEDAHKLYLPVDSLGKPMLNLLEKVKEANKEIKPGMSIKDIENIYIQRGIMTVDESGVVKRSIKPFVVFYGYTTDDARVTSGNKFISQLDSKEEDRMQDFLKPIFETQIEGEEKKPGAPWDWYTPEVLYKGLVAYELKPNHAIDIALESGNIFDRKGTVLETKLTSSIDRAKNLQTNTASVLKNN